MEMATAAMIGSLIGTGYSIYSGEKQAKAGKNAAKQAEARAAATAKASEEATNRANQKRPNTSAILDQMLMAGKTGSAGTMLTGPMGVDPTQLAIGRTSLLGA